MIEKYDYQPSQTGITGRDPCEDCKDLAVLESIAQNDHWTLVLDEILSSLIKRMVNISRASFGVIYFLNESSDDLALKAYCGLDEKGLNDIHTDLIYRDFARSVIDSKTYQLVYRAEGEQGFILPLPTALLVGIPLHVRDSLLGVAEIGFEKDNFGKADLRRLELLADHACVAIENAMLYEESRQREEDLRKANEELAALDKMKSEFLSLISHELRTPLTSIIGYVDLILRGSDSPLSEKQHKYLSSVRFSSRELLCLINNLIDFACLEVGQVRISPWPVFVLPMLERMSHFARSSAEGQEIDVLLDVEEGIPAIKADETKLQHALENVVSNAIKFSPGSNRIVLSATYSGKTNEVFLNITDFGIGIPKDKLERIWERFYQVDSSTTRLYGGLGLGLATAKKLVELMGGRIWAESAGKDKGSTFTIAMPAMKIEE